MNSLSATEIKIKNAAIYEFAHYGLAGARVDRIAKKAKVNKAMIYYYYKSKEKLYGTIISEVYKNFIENIFEDIPKDLTPDLQMEFIIKKILKNINDLDELFFKLFFKEIADGAKYIKKLVFIPIILPLIGIIQEIIKNGNQGKIFRNINPLPAYSFIPVIGSAIMFNLLKILVKDSDTEKDFFSGNYKEKFSESILDIYMNGILTNKEEK